MSGTDPKQARRTSLPPDAFLKLLRAEGLDPAEDLRFKIWPDLSFSGQKLEGCDFRGATLSGCDFRGAHIQGASFERAVLGVRGEASADLSLATDWEEHCREWRSGGLFSDRHLDDFECFQDAPFGPKLVTLPIGTVSLSGKGGARSVSLSRRVAVAEMPLTELELLAYRWLAPSDSSFNFLDEWSVARAHVEGWPVPLSFVQVERYLDWISRVTRREYFCVSEGMWRFGVHKNAIATSGVSFEWFGDFWREDSQVTALDESPWRTGDANTRVQGRVGSRGNIRRTSATVDGHGRLRVARALVR